MKNLVNYLFLFFFFLMLNSCKSKNNSKLNIYSDCKGLASGCPVNFTLQGPSSSETGDANPFMDYRFNLRISNKDTSFLVPGYYAADGNAANTGADSGDIWKAHFTPATGGKWKYEVSFLKGKDIAIDNSTEYEIVDSLHGLSGSFRVYDNRTGSGFYARGMLRYTGERYLKFDNGEYFLKLGPGSPENFLAYEDFDQTPPTHTYSPHLKDWDEGDLSWKNGKGKGIAGAVNYLSEKGVNSVYLLVFNLRGDGDDVWPWISREDRLRYDVSKFDQWQLVFDYMQEKSIHINLFLGEEENDLDLDNGNLGRERKLFYREMIARFAHFPAITWNLGEEILREIVRDENAEADQGDPTISQIKKWAAFIDSLDIYQKLITAHPYDIDKLYSPMLGYEHFHGAGIQTNWKLDTIYYVTRDWIRKSAEAGHPWVVSNDEQGGWQRGLLPDGENTSEYRKKAVWPCFLAGGAGIEFYFGYSFPHNDLNLEDFRSRDEMWTQGKVALNIMQSVPFHRMTEAKSIINEGEGFALYEENNIIAYFPDYSSAELQIPGNEIQTRWNVKFYDPVNANILLKTELTMENMKLRLPEITNNPSLEGDVAIILTK